MMTMSFISISRLPLLYLPELSRFIMILAESAEAPVPVHQRLTIADAEVDVRCQGRGVDGMLRLHGIAAWPLKERSVPLLHPHGAAVSDKTRPLQQSGCLLRPPLQARYPVAQREKRKARELRRRGQNPFPFTPLVYGLAFMPDFQEPLSLEEIGDRDAVFGQTCIAGMGRRKYSKIV
jgi:hypothetical protein